MPGFRRPSHNYDQIKNDSANTIKKQKLLNIELVTDVLVVGFITHLRIHFGL